MGTNCKHCDGTGRRYNNAAEAVTECACVRRRDRDGVTLRRLEGLERAGVPHEVAYEQARLERQARG